jgi:hypothetical protein
MFHHFFAFVLITLGADPVTFPYAGQDQYLSLEEQQEIYKIWPKTVPFPARLHFYTRSGYSQRLTITNGLDHHVWMPVSQDDGISSERNPNRKFPWATSGGTDDLPDFKSHVGVSFPKDAEVEIYTERVEAGARRLLPMYKWNWPKGSIFIDMLTHKNQVFEIRRREKLGDEDWVSKIVFQDADKAPKDFKGAGQSCLSCHGKTGSQDGYGIRIRGGDTVFSLTPVSLIPKK